MAIAVKPFQLEPLPQSTTVIIIIIQSTRDLSALDSTCTVGTYILITPLAPSIEEEPRAFSAQDNVLEPTLPTYLSIQFPPQDCSPTPPPLNICPR